MYLNDRPRLVKKGDSGSRSIKNHCAKLAHNTRLYPEQKSGSIGSSCRVSLPRVNPLKLLESTQRTCSRWNDIGRLLKCMRGRWRASYKYATAMYTNLDSVDPRNVRADKLFRARLFHLSLCRTPDWLRRVYACANELDRGRFESCAR